MLGVLDLFLDLSLEAGGVVSTLCFVAGDAGLELLEYFVLGVVLVAGDVVAFYGVEFEECLVCRNGFAGAAGSVEQEVWQ